MYIYPHCRVVRVIDGDTLEIQIDYGFKEFSVKTFRLLGVNAPEIAGATKEEGERWKQTLMAIVNDSDGRCVVHSVKPRKSFDRYLAVVELDDGRNLVEVLIDRVARADA